MENRSQRGSLFDAEIADLGRLLRRVGARSVEQPMRASSCVDSSSSESGSRMPKSAWGAWVPTKSISTSSLLKVSLCSSSVGNQISPQTSRLSVVTPQNGSSVPLPDGRPDPDSSARGSGPARRLYASWVAAGGPASGRSGRNSRGTSTVGGTRRLSCHSTCSARLRFVRAS